MHISGEGNGKPLQYSCLENPMDRGVWWTTVHGVARVRHDLATKPTINQPCIYINAYIYIYMLPLLSAHFNLTWTLPHFCFSQSVTI